MRRLKIAVGLAALIFMVLVGATSASAYWSSQAGASSTVKVASLASSCQNVTSVVNASFEQPVITQSWTWLPNGQVPGWSSTDPVGIEVWQSGYNGVYTPVGNQFVELNANIAGTLSQSISSTPGQILQWSLLHRGRAGVDTMQVLIGASASTLVPIRTISDGTAAWGRYSGAYIVPAGQTTTYLAFRAISTATGDLSVGNFMDDVSFGSGPCLTSTSAVSNLTNPGSTAFHIGDVLQYSTTVANIGSALSYKSALAAPLPAGIAYKAGTLKIDGTAETDGSGDDLAEYTAGTGGTGTINARLGAGASATVGGTIAQASSTTVTFQATVVGPVGTIVHYTPSANYVNGLAPLWAATPAVATDVPVTVSVGVDVGMTATTPSPATLTAGVTTPSTWTFTATNLGSAVANNVVVHLTSGAGYVSTSAPTIVGGAACTVTSGTSADCTIGDLAAGATRTITLSGYAAAGTAPGSLSIIAAVTSTSGDANALNDSVTGTATVVADTTAPTTVAGLAASATTGSQTTLTWTAATDNVGVSGYDVYRGAAVVATVTGTTYTDTLLTPSTAYLYKVKARDAAGNTSAAFSNVVTVTTTATFTPGVFYTVTNPNSGLCIDTGATPAVSGSILVINTCDTTNVNQKWNFVTSLNSITATANNYFVAPKVTNTLLVWDIINATSGNLAKADVKTVTTATTNEQWKPVVEAGGTFHFINLYNGRCLDINGASKTVGTQLEQYDCNGGAAQSFTLTGVN